MRSNALYALYATAAAALVAAAAAPAAAHDGPRIFLGNVNGKLGTYIGDNVTDPQDSTAFTARRVFTEQLPLFLNNIYTTEFPGFQANEVTGLPKGGYSFGIAGPLQYFDYNDPANRKGRFRPVSVQFAGGTIPHFGLYAGSQQPVFTDPVTPDAGGMNYFSYNAVGDHGHVHFTLYGAHGAGAGTTPIAGGGADGIYAVPLRVINDAAGLGGTPAPTYTFYVLYGKNVAAGSNQFVDAEAEANRSLVPEPGSAGVLLAAAAAGLLRRRRQANKGE